MSWSKIKNIMIIILVIINVFLIGDIALTEISSNALPNESGKDFVGILKKKNITVDEKIVPKAYEKRETFSVSMYSPDELATAFLGERASFKTEGNAAVATVGDKKLTIEGNYITFTAQGERTSATSSAVWKALKKCGLDVDCAVYDEKECIVKRVFSGIEVDGVSLKVYLSKDGDILYAEGKWPKIEPESENSRASIISAVMNIKNQLPENAHISDAEKIYVFEYVNNTPKIKNGWRISANGKSYVVSE